ncbi:Mss4-like protein [Scheffersomyces coipomensis]|uniref:Mss4-like protein n=1 Tax=Scheffersomyces coipomensis TaxID=1788519 RepID=UPI00315CAFCB
MVTYLHDNLPESVSASLSTPAPNSIILRCPFQKCNTRLLKLSSSYPQVSLNSDSSTSNIKMINLKSLDEDPNDTSQTSSFYQVNDVWDFDNIGVSRPSQELQQELLHVNHSKDDQFKIERILICSECDKGPLGLAGFNENDSNKDVKNLTYFLSCKSVLHDVKEI